MAKNRKKKLKAIQVQVTEQLAKEQLRGFIPKVINDKEKRIKKEKKYILNYRDNSFYLD